MSTSKRTRKRKPKIGRPYPLKDLSRRELRTHMDQQRKAIASTTICQLPMCESPPMTNNAGASVGVCLSHAFGVVDAIDELSDSIEADKTRLALRERRVARQLHEHYLGDMERESRRLRPGWIYYIQVGDRIKIGYSIDPKRRMREYPPDTPLLALHPGTKQLEAEVQSQFTGSRIAGREWFLDTPEIRAHIAAVIEQFGEPDRARYEHRGQSRRTSGFRAS